MTILVGDCLSLMQTLAPESVDSIVTDPPYHLTTGKKGGTGAASDNPNSPAGRAHISTGFMGRAWDGGGIAHDPATWAEALRVAKPGAYLVAFGGSRTFHRLACAIEDAGWELRDNIAWIYGSGFPKSHNGPWGGTALKPGNEPVVIAKKPLQLAAEWATIKAHLNRLEGTLCEPFYASAAASDSQSSQAGPRAASASVQCNAGHASNTPDASSAAMDTSLFGAPIHSCLSIVKSWRHTLGAAWIHESMSIIETASSTTTDWKTLRFFLSRITPESIIQAHNPALRLSADACIAVRYLSAIVAALSATLELSALAPVIDSLHIDSPVAGAPHELERIILARKPLIGTVAANVLTHGTGALNIDGCRVPVDATSDTSQLRTMNRGQRIKDTSGQEWGLSKNGGDVPQVIRQDGRWPANVIHDGSDEVLSFFPNAPGQQGDLTGNEPSSSFKNTHGDMARTSASRARIDSGSAARFFYCGKATKEDRNDGCEGLPLRESGMVSNTSGQHITRRDGGARPPAANNHPTVKPTALMRWLCRLVTPPGGTVLDPFMGSGSTGRAAVAEGFQFIGIELDPDYAAIAEARIRAMQPGLGF